MEKATSLHSHRASLMLEQINETLDVQVHADLNGVAWQTHPLPEQANPKSHSNTIVSREPKPWKHNLDVYDESISAMVICKSLENHKLVHSPVSNIARQKCAIQNGRRASCRRSLWRYERNIKMKLNADWCPLKSLALHNAVLHSAHHWLQTSRSLRRSASILFQPTMHLYPWPEGNELVWLWAAGLCRPIARMCGKELKLASMDVCNKNTSHWVNTYCKVVGFNVLFLPRSGHGVLRRELCKCQTCAFVCFQDTCIVFIYSWRFIYAMSKAT